MKCSNCNLCYNKITILNNETNNYELYLYCELCREVYRIIGKGKEKINNENILKQVEEVYKSRK